MRKHKLLYLEFHDHGSSAGWRAIEDLTEPEPCRAVGWLVKETKNFYILSSFLGDTFEEITPADTTSRTYVVKAAVIKKREIHL